MTTWPNHPQHLAHLASWTRARDVLAGEDAVKARGETYLTRLDEQADKDYAAYKARAAFFGATSRTLEEYLDLVFRRAPALALGPGEGLNAFAADCDLWGLEFLRYARHILREVLSVGRAGSLVLPSGRAGSPQPAATLNSGGQSGTDLNRPVVSSWRAEQILNWAVDRADDTARLSLLVLAHGDQLRAFRLIDGACYEETWHADQAAPVLTSRTALKRNSVPLDFIPFIFHGPQHSRPDTDKLPLADIIAANLDHYRLDADMKHGLHFAALPTAWVTGFDKSATLKIGSSTAWVSEVPGASAGFLEFTGAGLAYLERAMEKVERRMAQLGARMLELPDPETINTPAATLCGLGNIVVSLNESLTKVLRLARWWAAGPEPEAITSTVTIAMNTDLAANTLRGEDLTAVVNAWKSGAISRDTMLELLKRGEVLPDGRTVAQERALIHRN